MISAEQTLEIYRQVARHRAEGKTVVLATVVAASGSTPRKPGARMLVLPDGEIVGSIGGGCGEAEVWQTSREVLRTRQPVLMTVDLNSENAEDEGMVCGGRMEIFLEPL